ncbi:DUF4835 family protein [Myroides odoratimimus]|uniref:type IX secretion system protein PorD n=1 Tax=Myroides odoratimimus TaxID=76832 RepID=UPI000352FEDD|nr:DUF4835 family protein [Myroides odoratimimus]EPH06681.1 hypothetical protein HMPREF9713_03541 [Myroides odoratimimus CCUG 12700]MCA4792878.1 DUF4835 family protein [Myroides odoratimimus]MCA4820251.1 DUF4835 family protein [Myroides odoratimimus]MDM1059905.1 DUF4835 family protein [Myroides odoratimimus]MDM1065395.1 DUF4835 family protein [Myroides odoratimimus]
MNKLIWLFGSLFIVLNSYAQELNAIVTVNHSQVGNSNQAYFKSLEKSLKDFINNTSWTSKKFSPVERIDCMFFLNVTTYGNNTVSGTLQVKSSRPVYGSGYSTQVLLFNDKDIVFNYIEFEPLYYNPNSYDSNLTSLIGFYANLIIGLDAETFSKGGGSTYLQTANGIASIAQQGNYRGWKQGDGSNTRYSFISDLASGVGEAYKDALYKYHRLGLDRMSDNVADGRDGILQALITLEGFNSTRPNSFLTRVFFDSKTDELIGVYGGVTDKNKKRVVELLNKLAPLNGLKWNSL